MTSHELSLRARAWLAEDLLRQARQEERAHQPGALHFRAVAERYCRLLKRCTPTGVCQKRPTQKPA